MAFAIEAKAKGDEEKMGRRSAGCRRRTPRSTSTATQQTGEQILAGITQIHVEVIVDRMKERFGAEVELHPPHVPYREAIKGSAKAHARYKKQTGGRGSSRTATSRSSCSRRATSSSSTRSRAA